MLDKLTQLLAMRTAGMGQKPGIAEGAPMGGSAQPPQTGMEGSPAMPQIREPGFINNLFAKFGKRPSGGLGGWASGMKAKSPMGMPKSPMQGAPMGIQAPPMTPSAPPPASADAPMPESPMASGQPMRMLDNTRNKYRM